MLLDDAKKSEKKQQFTRHEGSGGKDSSFRYKSYYYVAAEYRWESGRKSRRNNKLSGCIRDRNQETLETKWSRRYSLNHHECNETCWGQIWKENPWSEACSNRPLRHRELKRPGVKLEVRVKEVMVRKHWAAIHLNGDQCWRCYETWYGPWGNRSASFHLASPHHEQWCFGIACSAAHRHESPSFYLPREEVNWIHWRRLWCATKDRRSQRCLRGSHRIHWVRERWWSTASRLIWWKWLEEVG